MTQHAAVAGLADRAEQVADDLDQLWRTDMTIALSARQVLKANADALASVASTLREVASRAEIYTQTDSVRVWAERRTRRTHGVQVSAMTLYEDYRSWCEANEHDWASLKVWGMTLTEMGWNKVRTGGGVVYLRRELVGESDA
jgi:phage/plasmid-associated DNA primase